MRKLRLYPCPRAEAIRSIGEKIAVDGYVRSKDPTILTVPDESRNRFKFDIAVLGASAIDEDGAVLEFDPLEV